MIPIQIKYSKNDENDSMNRLLCMVAIERAIRSALEMFTPSLRGMICSFSVSIPTRIMRFDKDLSCDLSSSSFGRDNMLISSLLMSGRDPVKASKAP